MPGSPGKHRPSPETEAAICADYLTGLSTADVGLKWSISSVSVSKILKRNGFKARDKTEARRQASYANSGYGRQKWYEFPCEYCGVIKKTKRRNSRYCSQACFAAHVREGVAKPCMNCGKLFTASPSAKQECCSKQCAEARIQFAGANGEPLLASRWHRGENFGVCKDCGERKDITEFHTHQSENGAQPYFGSICKRCVRIKTRPLLQKPKYRFNSGRGAAKRRGLKWTLTLKEYTLLITLRCHYCQGPLPEIGTGLDRVDNDKGYIPTNVVPCCKRCNVVKNSYFNFAEMMLLAPTLRAIRMERQRISSIKPISQQELDFEEIPNI